MERIPNAVYTKEFREEAVMLVTEGGLTIPEVARRLGKIKHRGENPHRMFVKQKINYGATDRLFPICSLQKFSPVITQTTIRSHIPVQGLARHSQFPA